MNKWNSVSKKHVFSKLNTLGGSDLRIGWTECLKLTSGVASLGGRVTHNFPAKRNAYCVYSFDLFILVSDVD